MKTPKKKADEHWAWVVRWLELIYKDAFIHGYKHGVEDEKKPHKTNKR